MKRIWKKEKKVYIFGFNKTPTTMNNTWTVVERTTKHQQWKSADGKSVLNIIKAGFSRKYFVFEEGKDGGYAFMGTREKYSIEVQYGIKL